MLIGQTSTKKHSKERTSEDANEYDQADCEWTQSLPPKASTTWIFFVFADNLARRFSWAQE
jgi:hypothetical protein